MADRNLTKKKIFNSSIGRNHYSSNSNVSSSFRNIHPNHFINYLKRSNTEVKDFLNRDGKIIIRMRGLPFDAVAKHVIDFFENTNLQDKPQDNISIVDGEEGVLFVHYPDGRATGDAFVMVKSEEEAINALVKHKAMMGSRYIELFRSTPAEVQQVLKRSQDPKNYQSHSKDTSGLPLPILPPDLITVGNRKDCIRLRNLPIDSGVENILEFLGVHSQHIIPQGVHMIFNAHGQPSGEAFIQFDSELSSFNVSNYKNGKCMYFAGKKFYLEVIQCSGEEMNLVLMGLLPSNLTRIPSTTSLSNSQNNGSPNYMLNVHNQFNSQGFYTNTNQSFIHHQTTQPPTALNGSITPNAQLPPSNQVFYSPNLPAPLFYYVSPPVSPLTSNMYMTSSHGNIMHPNRQGSCFLIIKNAPANVTVNDVLQFLNGYGDVSPEFVQIQSNHDNYGAMTNSLDIFITYFNPSDAERAVIEKNLQKLGNNVVELFMII